LFFCPKQKLGIRQADGKQTQDGEHTAGEAMGNVLVLLATMTFLLTSGCATTTTLKPGHEDSSILTVSGKSYIDVWKAASKAVAAAGLTFVEFDRMQGLIKAEKAPTVRSWGEVVAVYITPAADAPSHQIEVLSLKRSKAQIISQDHEQSIVAAIERALK
jgi:hypothetical protein